MDNKIEVFKNEQFGEVRTILEGEKVRVLCSRYLQRHSVMPDPNKAVNDHCRAITKRSTPSQMRESSEYQLHPGRRRLSANYSQQTSCG